MTRDWGQLDRETRRMQRRVGVIDDGDVGPLTLARIHAALDELERFRDAAAEEDTQRIRLPSKEARIQYIVVHHNGVPGRTIDDIRRTHIAKGWNDIGYHYVVHEDGTSHAGRPEEKPGAHAHGLNDKSLGVCVIGDGNARDFLPEQYATLERLLRRLMRTHRLPTDRVIGHREVNDYQHDGAHRTTKLCPGSKVDLVALRRRLAVAPV